MPELPEVEIARRNLVRWLKGRRIVHAEADATRIFRGAERGQFQRLKGKLEELSRRGKYLMFSFEGGRGLLAHLGMTGKFVRRPEGQPEPYSRARWTLDSRQVIHYRDPRMLGRMEPAPAAQLPELGPIRALGRDPLVDGLSAAQLEASLSSSRSPLKVALMDQGRLAGLGNLHVAEALFRARLHPARVPASLSPAEWRGLTRAIHRTIAFALRNEEDDEVAYVEEGKVENPFYVYGRAGEPCRQCKTPIEQMTQAGRTTYFCPKHQPQKKSAKGALRR